MKLLLLFIPSLVMAVDAEFVRKHAQNDIINPAVFVAMAKVESGFNSKAIGDDGKSFGVMQVSIAAAKQMGYTNITKYQLLNDPALNIKIAVKYLIWLFTDCGLLYDALDSYNRGFVNVKKRPYLGRWSLHPYVGKVIRELENENKNDNL